MFDHVEMRSGARNDGGAGWGGFDSFAAAAERESGAGRIQAQRPGWLTPLVLIGLVCASCDADRVPRRVSASSGDAARSAQGRTSEPPAEAPAEAPSGSGGAASEDPRSNDDTVVIDEEAEAWVALAISRLASEGRIDIDLPAAMHLALLASPRSNFVTVRQLLEHTAHLGARAYEDWLRANPGSDGLKAQGFLVALGADDTPGERPVWRRAHADVLGWILIELTGEADLASALMTQNATAEIMVVEPSEALTPIRVNLRVGRKAHVRVLEEWKAQFPIAASAKAAKQ